MTKKLTENHHILCNQIAIMAALKLILIDNNKSETWQCRQLESRLKETMDLGK